MINYERVITDEEQMILENDILDVKDWIDKAIEGKIAQCSKRLAKAEQERLIAEGADMIPASMTKLCASALCRKEYLNRAERDALELQGDFIARFTDSSTTTK